MNYLEEQENKKKELVNKGSNGIFSIIGGGLLLALNTISSGMWPGVIIGGIVSVVGNIIRKKTDDKGDKSAGIIMTSAGILTILASLPIPFIHGFSSLVLLASGLVLGANGIFNLFKFFKGVKDSKKIE